MAVSDKQRRKKQTKNYPGWIYFAKAEGSVKIKVGFSSVPRTRLQFLNWVWKIFDCPTSRLAFIGLIPGTRKQEDEIHRRYAAERIPPLVDWFFDGGKLREYIDSLADMKTIDQVSPKGTRGTPANCPKCGILQPGKVAAAKHCRTNRVGRPKKILDNSVDMII